MAIERIDYEKCTECGMCHLICVMDVFGTFGSKPYVKYKNDCVTCFQCILVCKNDAIVMNLERAQPIPPPRIKVS
jgi:NAD-dependent dihydropyrimidine dehydrogenase PreA subunit